MKVALDLNTLQHTTVELHLQKKLSVGGLGAEQHGTGP